MRRWVAPVAANAITVTEVSVKNFGFLIAYVIPGFVIVTSAATLSATVRSWLGPTAGTGPTVGGFLYATVASMAAGMIASAIRWLIVDFIHHHTGVPAPAWDFSVLQQNIAGFEAMVEYHYRYYQFYANTLIAILAWVINPRALILLVTSEPGLVAIIPPLLVLLFLSSRDALQKYYTRSESLLHTKIMRKDRFNDQWSKSRKSQCQVTS